MQAGIADALDMSADYLLTGRRTEYDLYLMDKRALDLTDRLAFLIILFP